jgi:hypothetical protein
MIVYTVTNPQAAEAIRLAHELRGANPDDVTKAVNASKCPRSLFVLASVLAAATAPGSINELSQVN